MLDVIKLMGAFGVLAMGLGSVAYWVTSVFIQHVQWGIELDILYGLGGVALIVLGERLLVKLIDGMPDKEFRG